MNILQINTSDKGGGAEGSAYNLMRSFRDAGHNSWLAVGTRYRDDKDVFEIPREAPKRTFLKLANGMRTLDRRGITGARRLARILDRLATPARLHEWRDGLEEFEFHGCARLLDVLPGVPDIIHCHNLHGWFFDLRMLQTLSRRFPVILNLRDTWLLTGHCAYFLDCEKWKDGCNGCPRLSLYPAIRKDSAAENWRRKQAIYAHSRLYATAPSEWLISQAKQSMLNAVQYKVIPNGIDTNVFTPGDRLAARASLGLPADATIVMFAAAAAKTAFKDQETLAATILQLNSKAPTLHFLCVGMEIPALRGIPNMHRLPYISSPAKMADCYRSADVFIHTARAEAFGKTMTEAMACGTPVAATAVGGIPEQIIPGKTGLLSPIGDATALAENALELCKNSASMRDDCAARGSQFSLKAQTDAFLNWYKEIIADYGKQH
ncbi:MAG: glycosyltransferase [Victivallales bacterium]|nr:glycosyltransferase [Victivallales bacterium]